MWGGQDERDGPAPPDARPVGERPEESRAREIRVLRAKLAEETSRRESLERQLHARTDPPPEDSGSAEGAEESPAAKAPDGWLDETLLEAAGFSSSERAELRERFEAIELRRLFIRDKAKREGWFRKPRYYKRMRNLNDEYEALREDWGDERYDWILFASGRSNRVAIERVMGDSAAAEIGLEPGDVFLRYDDERIFDGEALQAATAAGELGQTVALDVERRGERFRLYPPRGPLGVGLRVERKQPDPLY